MPTCLPSNAGPRRRLSTFASVPSPQYSYSFRARSQTCRPQVEKHYQLCERHFSSRLAELYSVAPRAAERFRNCQKDDSRFSYNPINRRDAYNKSACIRKFKVEEPALFYVSFSYIPRSSCYKDPNNRWSILSRTAGMRR